ncbi:MAG: 1-deoxy-D-xylulose-5-phosphate reductoisomerase [Clostridiales bacterium]|jgi:1-deoxy-D-xylulose-5-phosphate reductoisomerase|nr:1-deoxy-D-xylulose-5-phosphate reductoisomerase [Clostridiales bacterium]
MIKRVSVLGCTGSIGVQALDTISWTPEICVVALACKSDIDTLERQIITWQPDIAAVEDTGRALELKHRLKGVKTEILAGKQAVTQAAGYEQTDLVINSIVGIAGLPPTVEAIKAGKILALANKESLVTAGAYVMGLAREKGAAVLPVDSEHSAVLQCLRGNEGNAISKLYLTASGGPFRGYSREQLKKVTLKDTLKHPTWSMGRKITVDSATLMNKGLEVIEARYLFDIPPERIEALVHPQSVIHSMVEYADGAVMAQLGAPDMRLPIQYALHYPKRLPGGAKRLDFNTVKALTFEAPDTGAFPCLKLAYQALEDGGMYPAVLNGANEAAVELFLNSRISFTDIAELIEKSLLAYNVKKAGHGLDSIDEVLAADGWAREKVLELNS